MINMMKFLVGWVLGIYLLTSWVFPILTASVTNQTHITALVVLLVVVYTAVCGVVVCMRK